MITRHHKNLKGGRSWNAAFEGYLGKRCGTPDLSAFHAARAKAIISVMKVSTISGKSHDFQMEELRVVLLGKTGAGKSSLGSSLLGRQAFAPSRGLSSGTVKCQWAEDTVDGITLSLTDTPGLCDTHRSEEEVFLEVGKSVALACPGPHVFIIVLRGDNRFTKEEYDTVKTLQALFGERVSRHLMIVFTGGDVFADDINGMQGALNEQLTTASKDLKEVLCDAYNRYCIVSNAGTFETRREHAKVVLSMIQDVVRRNHREYFTNEMVDEYNRKVQEIIAHRQKFHEMKELRVVLLGKMGLGKSSLGNTLLGRQAFASAGGLMSVTDTCQWAEASVDGITLSVTDTPGLYHTHRSEEYVLLEVGKSVAVACPGPHVFIIVLKGNGRFTKEEYDAVKTLQTLFGERVRPHLMIVFTFGDDLADDINGMQEALEEGLRTAGENLKEVLLDANNCYCIVSNKGTFETRREHAKVVLSKIQDVVRRNNGEYFTNEMVNQHINVSNQRAQHLSNIMAVRETRQAIVEEKEEPGFFNTLENTAKSYILSVLSTVLGVGASVSAGAVAKRCSVM